MGEKLSLHKRVQWLELMKNDLHITIVWMLLEMEKTQKSKNQTDNELDISIETMQETMEHFLGCSKANDLEQRLQ